MWWWRDPRGLHRAGHCRPCLRTSCWTRWTKSWSDGASGFCRYADDLNVYVRSEAAGERVMASVTRFVEKRLRLRVKRTKSAVAHARERKFLGCRLLAGGRLTIAPQSWHVPRIRIREITRRNRGIRLERMISELNRFLSGWVTYFR